MAELCELWGVEKTRTTPYHPQANGMVERNNRGLGDSLHALLVAQDQEDWDKLLPQLMRAFRGTPHTVTGETSNYLMFGRELRLPDQLIYGPSPIDYEPVSEYAQQVKERLALAHDRLREQQLAIRQEDSEEPPLFAVGDWVLMTNKRRRKGENPKLQAKFIGPFQIIEAYDNHAYKIEKSGQVSTQSEGRLKLYRPCLEPTGQAPVTLELPRRPNMKGGVQRPRGRPKKYPLPGGLELPAPTGEDNPRSGMKNLMERLDMLSKQPTLTTKSPEAEHNKIQEDTITRTPVMEESPNRTEEITLEGQGSGRPKRVTSPPFCYDEFLCTKVKLPEIRERLFSNIVSAYGERETTPWKRQYGKTMENETLLGRGPPPSVRGTQEERTAVKSCDELRDTHSGLSFHLQPASEQDALLASVRKFMKEMEATNSKMSPGEVRRITTSESRRSPVTALEDGEIAPMELPSHKWFTDTTWDSIKATYNEKKGRCNLCEFPGHSRRVKYHIRQHFVKYACICGWLHSSRDSVRRHQVSARDITQHGGNRKEIFEIDATSYPLWVKEMKVRHPAPFGDCIPTTKQYNTIHDRLGRPSGKSNPTSSVHAMGSKPAMTNWAGFTIPKCSQTGRVSDSQRVDTTMQGRSSRQENSYRGRKRASSPTEIQLIALEEKRASTRETVKQIREDLDYHEGLLAKYSTAIRKLRKTT